MSLSQLLEVNQHHRRDVEWAEADHLTTIRHLQQNLIIIAAGHDAERKLIKHRGHFTVSSADESLCVEEGVASSAAPNTILGRRADETMRVRERDV